MANTPKKDKKEKIYQVLAEHPKGLSLPEMVSLCGMSYGALYTQLAGMDLVGFHLTEDKYGKLFAGWREDEELFADWERTEELFTGWQTNIGD